MKKKKKKKKKSRRKRRRKRIICPKGFSSSLLISITSSSRFNLIQTDLFHLINFQIIFRESIAILQLLCFPIPILITRNEADCFFVSSYLNSSKKWYHHQTWKKRRKILMKFVIFTCRWLQWDEIAIRASKMIEY